MPEDRGILLNETRRLHPTLCAFISEAVYDGRLQAHPSTAKRLRDTIYAAGGRQDPAEAYKAFRGRLPSSDALLRKRGFAAA